MLVSTGKLRLCLENSMGAPNTPAGNRVSAMRHGGTGTNRSPVVLAAIGADRVSVTARCTPAVAVSVTGVSVDTDVVAATNVADVAPAETCTVDWTETTELLLATATLTPCVGAAAERVTVQVLD